MSPEKDLTDQTNEQLERAGVENALTNADSGDANEQVQTEAPSDQVQPADPPAYESPDSEDDPGSSDDAPDEGNAHNN